MAIQDIGKISPTLLKKFGIKRIGFEYLEEFVASIKYIKVSPHYYFPSFADFARDRRVDVDIASLGGKLTSPQEGYLMQTAILAEEAIAQLPENLRKFYQLWYIEEVDQVDISRLLHYSQKYFYKKRDINRILICEKVERATLLVPIPYFLFQGLKK